MFSTLTDIDNSKTKKRRCSKAVTKHSELYSSIFYRLRVIKLKLKQIKIKVMTSKNLKLWRKKRQDYVPWYYIPSDTLRLQFTHRTIKFLTYDVLNARKKSKTWWIVYVDATQLIIIISFEMSALLQSFITADCSLLTDRGVCLFVNFFSSHLK